MIGIRITGRAGARIESQINRWRKGVQGQLLTKLAKTVVAQTKHRILQEQESPDGIAWWPRVDGASNRLLNRTGALLRSIDQNRTGEVEIHVFEDVEYGGFLQHGTRKMPDRPYMGLSAFNIQEIENVIDGWVRSRG
jgi:phage gpG-like protein